MFVIPGIAKNVSLPSGFSAPYEAETLAGGGEFIGGLGMVEVISYSDTPVGQYDELIYMPGRWKYADGTSGYRITRIFVSSKDSTFNGRRNWNIPKQVADFNVQTGADGITHISVSQPTQLSPLSSSSPPPPSPPFFKAIVTPITLISKISIPMSTSPLGSYLALIQPPLPSGSKPEEVGTQEQGQGQGQGWAEVTPVQKGKAHVVYVSGEMEDGKVGDGMSFPAVVPWSMGVCVENFEMLCGVAKFTKTR
ncbi:hypothetical protein AX16_005949 [Volvariella volvacea WC 439]|nr:hypothetical protein AX16_005949 [Volvariella volvacea WC 439]